VSKRAVNTSLGRDVDAAQRAQKLTIMACMFKAKTALILRERRKHLHFNTMGLAHWHWQPARRRSRTSTQAVIVKVA
jgi:hypothetical protein